jgi:hypothetical protein
VCPRVQQVTRAMAMSVFLSHIACHLLLGSNFYASEFVLTTSPATLDHVHTLRVIAVQITHYMDHVLHYSIDSYSILQVCQPCRVVKVYGTDTNTVHQRVDTQCCS